MQADEYEVSEYWLREHARTTGDSTVREYAEALFAAHGRFWVRVIKHEESASDLERDWSYQGTRACSDELASNLYGPNLVVLPFHEEVFAGSVGPYVQCDERRRVPRRTAFSSFIGQVDPDLLISSVRGAGLVAPHDGEPIWVFVPPGDTDTETALNPPA